MNIKNSMENKELEYLKQNTLYNNTLMTGILDSENGYQ